MRVKRDGLNLMLHIELNPPAIFRYELGSSTLLKQLDQLVAEEEGRITSRKLWYEHQANGHFLLGKSEIRSHTVTLRGELDTATHTLTITHRTGLITTDLIVAGLSIIGTVVAVALQGLAWSVGLLVVPVLVTLALYSWSGMQLQAARLLELLDDFMQD